MNGTPRVAQSVSCGVLTILLIGIAPIAGAKPVFQLDEHRKALALQVDRGLVSWEDDAERDGKSVLRVADTAGEKSVRFLLFDRPRKLPSPDQYRAEVWIRAESGACRLDFILYDADSGAERQRFNMIDRSPVDMSQALWAYGACDVSTGMDAGLLLYNIEVTASGRDISLRDLSVHTSDSILANGDFLKLEELSSNPTRSTPQATSGVPWGWRRLVRGAARHAQATGTFGLTTEAIGSVLSVVKGEGEYVLSAEPIPRLDRAEGLVARAFIVPGSAASVLPALILRQYGPSGLLAEDRAGNLWVDATESGDTLVSTGRIEQHPKTRRTILSLQFPVTPGLCRIRSVEVCSLEKAEPQPSVYVDQVGYDSGDPVRFIVATQVYPQEGPNSFVLSKDGGPERTGTLLTLGRCVGEQNSDWGQYYFEGTVRDVEPGSYRLEVSLGGREASVSGVEVGAKQRLHATGELAYRFYSVQRCGGVVPGWHGLCHMDDARLPDGTHVDVTGGYHNAGDFHKHMFDNTPASVYGMVAAYERHKEFYDAIDRDASGRADLLEEVVWGADWLRKMVDPRTGRIWMNVTNDIDYYGTAENETDGISGTDDDRLIGTDDPTDLGAFSMAAWAVLARYVPDTGYLESAEKLWAVYEERILQGYNPRHVFTAIELYRTTNDEKYRTAADRLTEKLFALQNGDGWFARQPGGPPEMRLLDEGATPAALAHYALRFPDSPLVSPIKTCLRNYFTWSFRLADNPFGIVQNYNGGDLFFFMRREVWYGGNNSEYCSTAWAAYLTARLFAAEPELAARLRSHAADQIHWLLGMNPLDLCMFAGRGSSDRIYFHHLYAEIPGHPRGAVPGAIPNGIVREPGNTDRPWFDLRTASGSLPAPESAEPWLPHNAYYLLMLSACDGSPYKPMN